MMNTQRQLRELMLARVGCKSGLGKTTKMPCPTYSLPAQACKVGQSLAKIPGTVCEGCYADDRGNYARSTVQATLYRRLDSILRDTWTDDMVVLIRSEASASGYFRWHDSGDVQSIPHLMKINDIAWRLPEIKFWLPTRERGIVVGFLRSTSVAPNLTIRLSATRINGPADTLRTREGQHLPVSYVHTGVAARTKGTRVCPAPTQGGKCQSCRSCWNPNVNVSYHKH